MNVQSESSVAGGISRRNFLKASTGLAIAAAAVPAISVSAKTMARSIGANDRIRIGQIGCGSRGVGAHMAGIHPHAKALNVEVVAVADPWRVARENAAAKAKEWFGSDAKQFVTYRDLLAMNEVDAVMIASCDHQHTTHLEAAAKAGKHIYVEKPMATEFDKLVRAVDAVKEAGVIAQVGTQIRSLPGIVGARELVKTGVLGKWSRLEECRNGETPYWYHYLKDVKEEDVDWKEFLMDRPYRPFRADVYSGWYGYYEFSRGPIPGFGSHFVDLVHFITGAKFPESCVCLGGTYTWKDEHNFTAPDCVQATWVYPEGFLVSSSNNLGQGAGSVRRFYADKGLLNLDKWDAPKYSPEGGPRRDGGIRGENEVKPVENPDHFLNWLQCIRENRQPHAPIDAGYQHAVAVIMAMMSYETGRKAIYDPVKRKIKMA